MNENKRSFLMSLSVNPMGVANTWQISLRTSCADIFELNSILPTKPATPSLERRSFLGIVITPSLPLLSLGNRMMSRTYTVGLGVADFLLDDLRSLAFS